MATPEDASWIAKFLTWLGSPVKVVAAAVISSVTLLLCWKFFEPFSTAPIFVKWMIGVASFGTAFLLTTPIEIGFKRYRIRRYLSSLTSDEKTVLQCYVREKSATRWWLGGTAVLEELASVGILTKSALRDTGGRRVYGIDRRVLKLLSANPELIETPGKSSDPRDLP